MSHGKPTPAQWTEIARYVSGHTVHDLGSGDLHLGHQLLNHDAARIVAVDHNEMERRYGDEWRIVHSYFHDYNEPIDIAFVSWPVNWPCGLGELVDRARIVIYVGSNTDGAACGDDTFWNALRQREVLAHIPARRNTLIVYGPQRLERELLPEESAAIDRSGAVVPFAKAYPGSVAGAGA